MPGRLSLRRGEVHMASEDSSGDRPLADSRLIGTWRLMGGTARGPDGQELPTPYGPKAMGLLTLNADGRLMAVLCDGRPILPDGTPRDYASYCGNYTFDGVTLLP